MSDYGLAIKILRKRFSLTQSELAEKVGVSNHAVSKWENGVNQPDITTLQTLCKLFDLTMDDFLRLANGEPEDEVFSKKEENSESQPDKKSGKGFNLKVFFMVLASVCLVFAIVGVALVIKGCAKGEKSSESSSSSSSESDNSLDLGEEISGSQTEFLNKINSSITLGDGISEYDVVGTLKLGEETKTSTSYKVVVDKKDGEIVKYYVDCPYENVNAYTDFNYVYTTKMDEKIRLSASAIDLSEYIEDIEEKYLKENITEIKAYKKGYTTKYVFGFTQEYANKELEEFFEELDGAFLNDCECVFTLSNSGISERISLTFTYKGNEYDFIASRQLKSNSTFVFPDFSNYRQSESVCSEIDSVLTKTKNLKTFSKVLLSNDYEVIRIETEDSSTKKAKIKASAKEPIYYYDGKIYDYSSNYEGNFPYYKKLSYEQYYALATSSSRYKSLFNLDFTILEDYVEISFKEQNGVNTDFVVYLNENGIDYFENKIGFYLYNYGIVKVIFSSNGDTLEKIEIIDEESIYKLQISQDVNVILPDFSSYGALIDGTNVISDVKTTKVEQYEFCSEALVDKETGIVYTLNGSKVRKYDKNHNLISEYSLFYPSGWCIGKMLGYDWNYIYYSVFDGYYCDFSDDNAVYSLNLTTGECSRIATNYSYTQIPVCVVNSVIKYESYHNGLVFDGEYDWNFVYFDSANNILVASNIIDGDVYIGAYDYDTGIFKKEKNDFIPEKWLCGEGYYREQGEGDIVGKYFSYVNIGNSSVNFEYLKVVDRHPNRYYESEIDAKWQIVKDTAKYTFTTYGVYEKSTGNFVYFPRKAEYRFFDGGVHVWDSGLNFSFDDMYWYTFYY